MRALKLRKPRQITGLRHLPVTWWYRLLPNARLQVQSGPDLTNSLTRTHQEMR